MEGDFQAEFVIDFAGDAVHPRREHVPLLRRQPRPLALPGLRHQFRYAPVVVRQDDNLAAQRRQQTAHFQRVRFARFVVSGIGKADRHVGGHQPQAALLQFGAQPVGVGGEEAPGAEFRADVAGFGDFVQHPLVGVFLLDFRKFVNGPGDRCVRNSNRHKCLSFDETAL